MRVIRLPASVTHPAFRTGVGDVLPIAFGMAAWGMMTGVAMVKSGMHLAEVLLMSVIVFAGSSQLAALPLIAISAPLWVILATAFCVNLRFVVFSIHLRPYVDPPRPFWRRMLGRLPDGRSSATCCWYAASRTRRTTAMPPRSGGTSTRTGAGVGGGGWCVVDAASTPRRRRVRQSRAGGSWGLGFAGILALIGVDRIARVDARSACVSAVVVGHGAAIVAIALPLKLNILVAIATAVVAMHGWSSGSDRGRRVDRTPVT